jgi:HEAT repeats
MKGRWIILALVGIGAIVVGLAWVFSPREPIYQGKPLSYWLDETKGGDTEQAQAALRSVGPAAVRFLLDQVAREHPARQRIYALIWPKLPLGLRQRFSPPVSFRNYGNPNSRVVGYLRVLDPQTAMPDLLKALGSSDSGLQITALAAIAAYGEQADAALPSLVALMKHPNGFVQRWAVFAVGRMGPSRKQAIPGVIAALKDDETSPLPG